MEKFKTLPENPLLAELSPEEVTLIFYLASLVIERSLTIDELIFLSNGLFLMSQVLLTISSQRLLINEVITAQEEKEAAEKMKEDKTTGKMEIKKLQAQIETMQQQMDRLLK